MTLNRRQCRVIFRAFEIILVLILIHLIARPHVYLYIGHKGDCFPNHCQCAPDPSIHYSFDNLTMINLRNVAKIQTTWEQEVSQLNSSLNGETIEGGGQPERVIVVSTWRSGSSYVGSILRSRPGTHYFYEPLLNSYPATTVRTDTDAEKALDILHNLFHCRVQDGLHITRLARNDSFFSHNPQLLEMAHLHNIRWDPTFVTVMCRRSPILAMKTVRLPLRHASKLLEDEKLNVRMIYLVRDPQATSLSRLNQPWCGKQMGCADLSQLCLDLVQDFNVARDLEIKYPQRFMVLQYEDLFSRSRSTNQLVNFLGMSKDALLAAQRQKTRSQFTPDAAHKFQKTQEECAKAMELWGYKSSSFINLTSTNLKQRRRNQKNVRGTRN